MSKERIETTMELLYAVEKLIEDQDLSEYLKVDLSCPAHTVAGRNLSEADRVEGNRLAREEWSITIRLRKPSDDELDRYLARTAHKSNYGATETPENSRDRLVCRMNGPHDAGLHIVQCPDAHNPHYGASCEVIGEMCTTHAQHASRCMQCCPAMNNGHNGWCTRNADNREG